MRIYLDDERNPKRNDFIVVRNYKEFCSLIDSTYSIWEVSLDHDLGEEKNGMDCLKYMIEKDMDMKGKLLSDDFIWNAHTANPCGRDNIESYIKSYLKQKENNCEK